MNRNKVRHARTTAIIERRRENSEAFHPNNRGESLVIREGPSGIIFRETDEGAEHLISDELLSKELLDDLRSYSRSSSANVFDGRALTGRVLQEYRNASCVKIFVGGKLVVVQNRLPEFQEVL